MKVVRNDDRVGTEVTVSENMTVLHSVTLSGAPLAGNLKVEFLKGDDVGMMVQTTRMTSPSARRETKMWDVAAVVTGDIKGDKLDEFKVYAEQLFPDAEKPMITFRSIITHESEPVFHLQPTRTAQAQVVHSLTRELDA